MILTFGVDNERLLTISFIATSQIIQLDVPSDMSLLDFKALIVAEVPAVTSMAQHLYHNGRLLGDSGKLLGEYGISDGDMIVLHTRGSNNGGGASPDPSSSQRLQHQQQAIGAIRHPPGPSTQGAARGAPYGRRPGPAGPSSAPMAYPGRDSEMIRLQVLGDPRLMEELKSSQPELASAVNDPERFGQVFQLMEQRRAEAEKQKLREIQMLNDDPFNIEAQRKIEDLIRQEAVMENLQNALEHTPEAFGRVTMLYIPVEVNGMKVKAFVDSGAQATIMSPSCAESCGIMRLIDTRFAGIARGVGTAKILGRVHSAQIRIGNLFLACSFTVMEGKGVSLLLGLDMLKRHQAVLDFKKGCLIIQNEEVQFLGESEIPKTQDEMGDDEPMIEGPGGSMVGGRTGALVEPPVSSTPAASFAPQLGGSSSVSGFAQPTQDQQKEPEFPAEAISQLEGLGFSRSQAVRALSATGGDVDMAASLLFQ